jgi:hypothetical protein
MNTSILPEVLTFCENFKSQLPRRQNMDHVARALSSPAGILQIEFYAHKGYDFIWDTHECLPPSNETTLGYAAS